MKNIKSNYLIYAVIILVVTFYGFLTGCKGSSSSDNPIGVYYSDTSTTTPQTIDVNITQDGRILRTSSPSGRMTLEAPEDNTYNSNVVVKITENPSMGNESSFLTVGSLVYSITATRDGFPVNLLSHPVNLTLSNEERLDGAENYYIGIKDINGGEWQFVNLYSSNPSVRASLSSRNQFSYSLYKNNILVALFSDVGKSLRNTPKVLGASASLSQTAIEAERSYYNEDLKVNILLAGENLSGLKAEDFKIKIAYLNSDSRDTTIKVDDKNVSYLSGSGSNKYEGFGQGYAHYFQFVPLSSKYSSGYSPTLSFDINLKDTLISGFPNSFIVEISNSNSSILPFGYSSILNFSINTSSTSTETNTDTNTDTETETETETQTQTDTNTNTNTDTGTGTNTDTEPKATLKLNSPTADFPVTESTIELEFSKDVPWVQNDQAKITIDNNAEISGCSYNNKILTLLLKNKLNYANSYTITVSNLSYAEDNSFTITTEEKATVSLKSVSVDFTVKDTPIEIEFSKEIPWTVSNNSNVTINNNVNITSYRYNNKVLSLSFADKLIYSKTYTISVSGIESVIDNNSLTFTTQSLEVTPIISSTTQNIAPNTEGLLTILQPKFFINFGKGIVNANQAFSGIKLNSDSLPQSCRITFDAASQTATIQFTEDLEYDTEYELSFVGFTDDDGAVINSSASALSFKTKKVTDLPGSGTEEDPFLIYTEAHLRRLNELSPINYMNSGFYYKQMADIELKEDWIPIILFKGNYNGNNKYISGIQYENDTEDYIGLFSVTNNSVISNLTIKNVNIKGRKYIGSLVGNSKNSNFENIIIEDSDLSGNSSIGCLIGESNDCDFRKISINGSIKITSNNSDVGGLIGCAGNSSLHSISNSSVVCDNTSFINGNNEVGGLIGRFYGMNSIEKSYSKIVINGRYNVGGLIGYADNGNSNISNCFSDAYITVDSNYTGSVGGLIGDCSSSVSSCYASGTIFLNSPRGSTAGVISGRINAGTNMNNNFSRVTISVGESYNPNYSDSYNPAVSGTPLWFEGYSSYSYNASGTNYVSEGYKESLNWDSSVWDNLTEGALPTLKE